MPIDNLKIFSNFSPIIAQPIEKETEKQFLMRWEKFDALPEKIKSKLSNPKTPELIKNLGQRLNLAPEQSSSISRAIRSYYFGELKLEDMPAVLTKEIPIDLAKAQEISRMVIQRIINDNSVEQATQARMVQMTVADALKAYPEVGEQLITSEKIELKNFPGPVRPCLKNWLLDFNFTLGRDKRTAMDRGIYLFQSTNGKRLNSQDRNKLAYVLKAFDENMPVTINKDAKQIIFTPQNIEPAYQTSRSETSKTERVEHDTERITPTTRSSQPLRSSDIHQNSILNTKKDILKITNQESKTGIRFSSPQKLPYEKAAPIKTDSAKPRKSDRFETPFFRYNPVSGIIDDSRKKDEPRELPGNVINLKDNF